MNSEFELLKEEILSQKKNVIELQTLLSSIPAVAPESGGDGEEKKCAALKKWLLNAGFSDEQFTQIDAPDSRVSCGFRPNLILSVPGKKSGGAVWVMAHLDVVPPGDLSMWKSDPWKVVCDEKEEKLTGRGVEDNQQGLVSAVAALLSLHRKNVAPSRTVNLLFMADEECGSEYGIKYLLNNHSELFKKEDLIVIPDGGDPEGKTIEIAEKNILWLKIHTKGLQTHGSMPDKGKNAAVAGASLLLELNGLERFFDKKDELFSPPYSTFQPTKKEANVETVNIIPGDDIFYMDCRILPCYTLEQVRTEIQKRVKKIEETFGVSVEVTEVQKQESPATSAEAPVVKELARALKETHGIDAVPIGIGGGTVGAELRNFGFDAAIWSTMDEVCHQPNEYCYVKNILNDALTMCSLFIS